MDVVLLHFQVSDYDLPTMPVMHVLLGAECGPADWLAEQERLHAVIDTTFKNCQAAFAAGCCVGVTHHSAESGLQCFS